MSLYTISSDILKLQQMVERWEEQEEWEGKVEIDFVKLFNQIQDDFSAKLSNCVKYLINQESKADALDTEIKRLQSLKKSYQNKADSMKNNIDTILRLQWIDKIETDIAKLSYRASEWVVVTDASLIPDDYKITKTETNISISLIKDAIKKGKEVPGAIIEQRQNLQIK